MDEKWRKIGTGLLIVFGLAGAVEFAHPRLEWRVKILAQKARGEIAGATWAEVLKEVTPGLDSRHRTRDLLEGDVFGKENPYDTPADREIGERIFRHKCAGCHGVEGRGLVGSDLTRGPYRTGADNRAIFWTIQNGIANTVMPSFDMSEDSIWRLVAHVQSLMTGGDPSEEPAELTAPAPSVSFERLRDASTEPQNWLLYGGDYASRRFSELNEITPSNVEDLELAWTRQLVTPVPRVEANPLVAGGIMYVSEPPSNVLALDAVTGEVLWKYRRSVADDVPACCGRVNRGVALLGDRVFIGTLDAHLVALDARSGAVEWEAEVARPDSGYTVTGAPLAVKDLVVVGIAGGEYGIRGFLDAYDANTGERVWRFHTIPGPGEPGAESWEGDSWKTGGGPTWMIGSFDPELDLLYWGIGNPAPPWNDEGRAGANLYTNSVVALDPQDGNLEWHFQFTPHGVHDWDATQVPVLVDRTFAREERRLMLWANRNAFFYVLDRETGEFLNAAEFAKQTWAARIDSNGQPVRLPNTAPSPQGTLVSPAGHGATNWWPPAYSPLTRLLYVPTIPESSTVYYSGEDEYESGEMFLGSAISQPVEKFPEKAIRALDPQSGRVVWEHRFDPMSRSELPADAPPYATHSMGGPVVTAGGVVFAGADDEFVALDADDGEELWSKPVGGQIVAPTVTYLAGRRQHVTVAAGRTLFTFRLRSE